MSLCCSLPAAMLCILLGTVSGCDFSQGICGAQAPGDILIGLMMPCHSTVEALHERTQPEGFTCTDFDLVAFMRSLAAIYTIEEINEKGFIPGVHLGYVMCDTCTDATKALQNVEHMLSINGSLSVQCNYSDFRPPVKAILGARYSETSIAVARLLSVYMVPQVSCTASSPVLSDKLRYPSFLRTIPSDAHQTKAFAKLMEHFEWNYVGVVYGDDDYGKAAFSGFLLEAEKTGVCIAYQEVIPHYLDHEHSAQRIKEVGNHIRASKAQVVLLILKPELVENLFDEMLLTSTTRIWIASDSWCLNRPIAHMDRINQVGDIFGFNFISRESESFDNYLKNLRPTPGGRNDFIKEYKEMRFNCTLECFSNNPPPHCLDPEYLKIKSEFACNYNDPQEGNDDFLVRSLDTSEAYSERVAIWAMAHALKELLQCNESSCQGDVNFPPWKLLKILKKVQFELEGQKYFFDKHGDFVDGYDLIMWEVHGNHRIFQKSGSYRISGTEGQVYIEGNITWLSTSNHTVPLSRCSERCSPGTVKKISGLSCCYNCTECLEGTYADNWDLPDCKACPNETWSLRGSTHCSPRIETFLRWGSPHPIVLVASASFGVLLLFGILIVFLVHRNSAPMKRAEVRLSCVMMAGLAVSFASVICFMGKPNIHLCRARQIMYGMGFTLCISCILVKAFRTFLAFLPFGQLTHRRLNKLYMPPVIVTVATALQGIICLLWLVIDSPKVKPITPPQNLKLIITCNEGSTYIGFGIMLSYMALLALVCFLLAIKGRKVPQEFSETGYIIFSMLMYLFVWICFIPVYIVKTAQDASVEDPLEGSLVQASAILVSCYGVIFCHFIPKCYQALCGSKKDTFEKYLNRVSITPIIEKDPDTWDRDSGVILGTPSLSGSTSSTNSISFSNSSVTLDLESPSLSEAPSTHEEKMSAYQVSVITSPHLRKRRRSFSF